MTRAEWNFCDGMNCGEWAKTQTPALRLHLMYIWADRSKAFWDGLRAGLSMENTK